MSTNVPHDIIKRNNPPLVGFDELKRSKVVVENACSPPTSLLANSGTGMINGDVTAFCVRQDVSAFDRSNESKVEFHNLYCKDEFSATQEDANLLGDSKIYRNDFSDLKSEACKQNGNGFFSSLILSIVDHLKIMDGSQEKENICYDSRNYKSIFEDDNKPK